ncbi:MAG: polysaccharide export protein [Proteobacteria bacterium]|jgi:polysaccharide export outer membrane protein|nr:polysaccharide export protein [Pseudomonadota bacterium]
MKRLFSFLFPFALLWLSALPARAEEYTIHERELIQITVYEHADISGDYRVSGDGTIFFPLLGILRVAGLTEKELQEKLTAQLADGFLVNPQITVRILEYRDYVYITGEVKKPGAYSYEENMTVIKAVTLAGGFTELAAPGRIKILRKNSAAPGKPVAENPPNAPGKEKEIKAKIETLVFPNDIIIVPERIF